MPLVSTAMFCATMTLNISTPQSKPQATQPAGPAVHFATGFIDKTITLDGQTYAYSVFVPKGYSPDTAWPMILFLHGSGDRGSDGLFPTEIGIGRAIRRNRAVCPAIVVMPQCRKGKMWAGEMLEMALRCVEKTAREYRLDQRRLYLTGLSLGGNGTWVLGAEYAKQFAAIAPICGFVSRPDAAPDAEANQKLAAALKDTPVWTFHGSADPAVNVEHTRAAVQALRAVGADVKYTEYPGGKHNVWDRAYGDPKFWQWLFAQRRDAPDSN